MLRERGVEQPRSGRSTVRAACARPADGRAASRRRPARRRRRGRARCRSRRPAGTTRARGSASYQGCRARAGRAARRIGETSLALVREPPRREQRDVVAGVDEAVGEQRDDELDAAVAGRRNGEPARGRRLRCASCGGVTRGGATATNGLACSPMPQPWTTSASASLGGRRRHRHARRGLGVLHLEPRRARSIPTIRKGCSSATRASSRSCGCTLNGDAARAARGDHDRSVQRRVRVARASVARAAPTRTSCCSGAATSGAGMREDLEIENFGEEAAFCSVEIVDRRRLRRPVRGEGGPRRTSRASSACSAESGRGSRSRTSAARSSARRTSTSASEPRIAGDHVHYEVDRAAARHAGRRACR